MSELKTLDLNGSSKFDGCIKRATLSNDRVFKKVISDEVVAKGLLNAIFNEVARYTSKESEIVEICQIETQKEMAPFSNHSLALDSYIRAKRKVGNQIKHFDVEMQVTRQDYIAKRARLYLTMLDLVAFQEYDTKNENGKQKAERFRYDLQDICSVFFYDDKESIENRVSAISYYRTVDTLTQEPAEDGRELIFINYRMYPLIHDNTLQEFCEMLCGKEPTDFLSDLTSRISNIIAQYNGDKGALNEMTREEYYGAKRYDDGYCDGERKGKELGKKERDAELLRFMERVSKEHPEMRPEELVAIISKELDAEEH